MPFDSRMDFISGATHTLTQPLRLALVQRAIDLKALANLQDFRLIDKKDHTH
jgi:hypothetical protein